jgi:hypothetical protein
MLPMNAGEAAEAFRTVQVDPSDPARAALKPHLSDTVQFTGPLGRSASGADATLKVLQDPQVTAILAGAQWTEPSVDGDIATIKATLPAGMLIGGATVTLRCAAGLIEAIEYEMLRATPLPPSELVLTDRMKEAVDTALSTGNPVLVAYVRPDGYSSLSFRGSTQVWSDTALAIWVRNPEGGLLAALDANDHVTLWYRRPDPVTIYQFWGRARVQNDDATRETVYAHSPEPERRADPQRRGIPIVIDLERIEGREGRQVLRMERPPA